MAIELQLHDARLDYRSSSGTKGRLEVVGTRVRLRVDLPTWEFLILEAPLREVLGELLRLQNRPEPAPESAPLFHAE